MASSHEKQRIVADLETLIVAEEVVSLLCDDYDELPPTEDAEKLTSPRNILSLISATRYLLPRTEVPKSKNFFYNVLPKLENDRWRQEVRMSKESLRNLLRLISRHPVFQNNSRHQQARPVYQLVVFLHRLGCEGTPVGKIARHFGISEGSVELYCERCLKAILSLEKKYVPWPNKEQKSRMKQRILTQSGFPNCIGFAYGTIIVLAKKPSLGGSAYFSHKNKYGISALIVCDDQRRILHGNAGFCGAAHDNRVYRHSKLKSSDRSFFEAGEYLLTDSGFAVSEHIIPCYKKPAAERMDNEKFNKILASARVVNEHCIGMVKGRFPSLRSLNFPVRTVKEHKKVIFYTRACVVLHNFLLDDLYDSDRGKEKDKDMNGFPETTRETGPVNAIERREQVKRIVLENNGYFYTDA
ncbi:hypothetical protein RvY_10202 [Ramazzottius varieornatus]|uniref:DDE Tnp4 domain-containing protein n=1 Tax=Ramazzottius varieornatus TaxID=947166 RepID=A0A1D1VC00_RAMVA|nr:hypothetical protein RvY_10202 [Ramazzottius varieornatus]